MSSSPYRPRLIDGLLDELLEGLPAVMLVGPRAAGKTTTAARRAATVVNLDDPLQAAAFAGDAGATLRGLAEPVLLDEWQAVPEVLGAIKQAVDADFRAARFLLTGSVEAARTSKVWPGTGRVVRVAMFPMTVRERLGRLDGSTFFDTIAAGGTFEDPADPPDLRGYVELALHGGFPAPALTLPTPLRRNWLEGYVTELLHRDVPSSGGPDRIRDPQRLRRYFEAYALNSAGVTEHKTIFDAAGVSKVTGIAYEDLLTDLFVAERVPGWASNRLRRLVRQPKRYLVDPSLLAAALHVDVAGIMRDGDLLGRIVDTFVAAQLRPEVAVSVSRPRIHHLRTREGRQEIDLVAELNGGRVIGIEIKAGGAPVRRDARHLAWLRNELGERFAGGVVFHTGPRIFPLGEGIVAVPIASLWETRGQAA